MEEQTEHENWIEAVTDSVGGLYILPSCLIMTDLNGDGDNKLVLANLGNGIKGMKLKVMKGSQVVQENSLLDLPVGICYFYMDTTVPRTPGLAVASGPNIYVYKNMKPYYKYSLPLLPLNSVEEAIWHQARNNEISVDVMRDSLLQLKSNPQQVPLTSRTLHFLQRDTHEDLESFVGEHSQSAIKRQTVITCIATIKQSMPEDDAISCIIVGTENKEMFILDAVAFSILQQNVLPEVPTHINVSGLFDVDFRIFVACRNGRIYTIKKATKEIFLCLELHSHIVALERVHKNLIVACMDNTLSCYSNKGKKMWQNTLPAVITCTGLMDHRGKGFKAVMVGMKNNQIYVYKDKYLVDRIKLNGTPSALLFGKYGREDSTLIAVTTSGALQILIMKRKTQYEGKEEHRGPPPSQAIKLDVPKKTQLFVDQTIRERENAQKMFRVFQSDLQKFKLTAAKTYLQSLQKNVTPISADSDYSLKITATVQGFGPNFLLIVSITNTVNCVDSTQSNFATGLQLVFKYPSTLYKIHPQLVRLPALVPGCQYKFQIRVECIMTDHAAQDTISAVVFHEEKSKPIVTANIEMPASEAVIVV